MGSKKNIIDGLRIFKHDINKDISIDKMIFFGSRAVGKPHQDSDIDLILVSPKFRKTKFRYRRLGFHKHWNMDYPVDFLCYTPEEFDKLKKQVTIVREAVREGIEIK